MATTLESPSPRFMRQPFVPEIPESLRFNGSEANPLAGHQAFREAAWKAFLSLGLPHQGDEDYSFLSARELNAQLAKIPVDASWSGSVETLRSPTLEMFSAWTQHLAQEKDASSALAMALTANPQSLKISTGKSESLSLSLQTLDSAASAAGFIQLEKNASAQITLSSDVGPKGFPNGFLNASLTFVLEADSKLELLQIDSAAGMQAMKLHFILRRNAKLHFVSASTGSRLSRLALEVTLAESGAEADIRGAAVVGQHHRCHRHLRLRHHAPHCQSRQLFKSVVLGSGRNSVDGTVIVDRGAQQTDAKQLIQHLLLSNEGHADSKPRLLIHADDVKCNHGATVGKLDPEQQFYLRSRGLDVATANRLLTQAYLTEALGTNAFGSFRDTARDRLLSALLEGA